MALVEELTTSGDRLFRWRSYPPLVLVSLYAVSVALEGSSADEEVLWRAWEVLWLPVSVLGWMIRAYTVGHTPWGTSGRNTGAQVAETLNTTGAYSIVRHPLYLGNFFMGLGVALFTELWWLVLIYCLSFWLYYERIMLAEESFLRRKFGTEYAAWSDVTPTFVPDVTKFVGPALPFSVRNVLRREYNGAFAVVVVVLLLEVVAESSSSGTPTVDAGWVWTATVSTALWLATRTVKRRTTWLHVHGR